MPYRKRMKYTPKKRSYKTTKTTVNRIVRNYVQSREEIKRAYVQLSIAALPAADLIGSSWGFYSLLDSALGSSNLVYGDAANQRVGNKIRIHSIEWIVNIIPQNATTSQNGNFCRLLFIHNKECRSAVTSAGTIVNDTANITTSMNLDQNKRITILKDTSHQMFQTTTAVSVAGQTFFTYTIYPRSVVNFQSNATSIAAVIDHDWGVALCASDANCCAIKLLATIRYTDM